MATPTLVCPECGKEFDTPRRLAGHRIAHKRLSRRGRPRAVPAPTVAMKNAAQATEVVKTFCEKMNPGYPFFPTGATLEKGMLWMVKVNWGFLPLVFEVQAATGEILQYYRKEQA